MTWYTLVLLNTEQKISKIHVTKQSLSGVYLICKQQRSRSSSEAIQSDQGLFYTSAMQHLAKPLISLLGCIGGSGFLLTTYALKTQFAPPHDKTNKMACAPSEDSDQSGHPPSLIRVFVVRMKKALVLSYPLSAE